MRIYEYRDMVQGLPNITQAMKRLRGMPALRKPGSRGYSEEIREEARALAGAGMTRAEIARVLNVSSGTITNWLDPEALRIHRKRVREYSAQRREENRRQKQEAANRAAEREARRVGGSLAEAYSLVHKLDAPLAKAHREATDPEVKKLLDEAVKFQHMVLYRVVSALGAS
jgi:transposase